MESAVESGQETLIREEIDHNRAESNTIQHSLKLANGSTFSPGFGTAHSVC